MCVTLKTIPIIRCAPGLASEMIAVRWLPGLHLHRRRRFSLRCGLVRPLKLPPPRCPLQTRLDEMLRAEMGRRSNLFEEALSGVSVASQQRPVMVLFDRNNIDLPIMLQVCAHVNTHRRLCRHEHSLTGGVSGRSTPTCTRRRSTTCSP